VYSQVVKNIRSGIEGIFGVHVSYIHIHHDIRRHYRRTVLIHAHARALIRPVCAKEEVRSSLPRVPSMKDGFAMTVSMDKGRLK
jgi:hypothetical protein